MNFKLVIEVNDISYNEAQDLAEDLCLDMNKDVKLYTAGGEELDVFYAD